MGQDWSVRAYHDGDEEAMLGLYRAVYGETMGREEWLEQWRWKYRRNPVGSAVIWLAEAGGKLVGQYPLNPVRMKAGGEVVTGVQMVELMTHPDYRQQGISLALAEQALGDARSRGLDITYGFPNKQAYPSHIRAGYTDVGAQGAWIMPLNTDRILEKWLKNRLPAKIFAAGAGLVLKGFSRTHELPEVEGSLSRA
jgi:GNAT superfamily N-acetyltransferase